VRGSLLAAAVVLAVIGVGVSVQAATWVPGSASKPSSLQVRPVLNVSVSVGRGGHVRTERVLPVQCPTAAPASTSGGNPPPDTAVVLPSSLGCLDLGPAELTLAGLGSGVQVVPLATGAYDVVLPLSAAQARSWQHVAALNYHRVLADVVNGRVLWLPVVVSTAIDPDAVVEVGSLGLADQVSEALARAP